MAYQPLYDSIVVKPIKAEEKTASGLILPNADVIQQYAEGVVVAVGHGWRNQGSDNLFPLTVKVGQTVLYRKASEIAVKDENGDDLFILSEMNVLAIRE